MYIPINGFIRKFIKSNFIFVAFINTYILILAFKNSLINKTITYPFTPNIGSKIYIHIILVTRSIMLHFITSTCLSRPFKSPSTIIST